MLAVFKMLKQNDSNLSIAIGAIIGGLYVTNLADGLALTKGTPALVIAALCKLLILAALALCIKAVVERANKLLLGICIALLAVLPLQGFLFRDTWPFFTETYVTFATSIFPGMICFSVLQDYRLCLRVLRYVSLGVAVLNWLVILLGGGEAFTKYNMGYANALVLPTNLLVWHLITEARHWRERLLYAVAAVGNVIGIFTYGSRGALVCVLAFCVYVFFKVPVAHKYGRRIKVGILLTAVVLLIFYRPILSVVLNALELVGFRSRTLELLISDVTHDSGRMALWKTVWTDFATNILAVRGINSDYALIRIYSHNAVLELLHAFGICGGAVVLGGLWGIVTTFGGKTDAYGVVRVLLLFSFMPLCFWSGSVWTSMYLWLWLVVCLRKKHLDAVHE